jgi:hypothetical protein
MIWSCPAFTTNQGKEFGVDRQRDTPLRGHRETELTVVNPKIYGDVILFLPRRLLFDEIVVVEVAIYGGGELLWEGLVCGDVTVEPNTCPC